MAWTNPKTWSFGEILTSTDMNTYVRDNTLALRALGIGSNVVQTVKDNTFSTSASGVVDVTGVTATITPSAASNKVLVQVTGEYVCTSSNAIQRMYLTDGADTVLVQGAADGSRSRASFGHTSGQGSDANALIIQFLHSPATTSPVTYKLRAQVSGSNVLRFGSTVVGDTNDSFSIRVPTVITLIEVAG